jgi:hypothetical protein
MYKAIKKSNGVAHPFLLNEQEKTVWETHPITRGKYRFEDTPEKPKTQPPIEAKDIAPKNQGSNLNEHKTRKK